MKYYSANYILPVVGEPIKNGILAISDNDEIVDILHKDDNSPEKPSMEFYNGVLVPGFINTHCHLELSHLKGMFEEKTGIAGFISQVKNQRNLNPDEVEINIKRAITTSIAQGTVAIGDICNSIDTLDLKLKSVLKFYNFIEVFGLNSNQADDLIEKGIAIRDQFKKHFTYTSLTPHATYSISEKMWNRLSIEIEKQNAPLSIHYGESREEYDLHEKLDGNLANAFTYEVVKDNLPKIQTPSNLVNKYLPKTCKILFVHNTYSTNSEIDFLKKHFSDPYFILCPSSNLFIENKLPDIPMLMRAGVKIALGTDSYASSHTLSVFDQIMILLENFPGLAFHEVLEWGTINGAKALGFDDELGSFEVGKKPGIILITNFDFQNMRPTNNSQIKKIL